MKLRRLIAAIALAVAALAVQGAVKVACIGNSITHGTCVDESLRASLSYPAQLQRMLGPDYEVGNFGHPGATLLNRGHRPYTTLPEWTEALAMRPDIAVIHLGINDTDPRNWPLTGDDFIADYSAIIDSLRAVNPDIRILIARLSPINAKHHRFRSGTRDWRLLIQDRIEAVARLKGVELIDFDSPLRDRQNLMPDGLHPDATGYSILASTVTGAITGRYGGLRMAPYYQSGMILQRHRPLTLRGMADAGSIVTLTLDGIPYMTRANNRGEWSVVTAPLADGSYTMTVTDGRSTLTFADILAGEVWVASGQSNMEFPLRDATGSASDIAAASDPQLRFYNMRPLERTDLYQWSDSVLSATDQLNLFRPSRWTAVSSDNVRNLSAIAYWFGRHLRDSLGVPVGIVSNAIGGAPCESWIDVNTLEAEMPEILCDWRRNDYVQKWCQGRADLNAPSPHRHPYEPSYLFSAGIRPLSSPDIAGVIWYQGESNAHNMELHEQLFPMLIESWRREFRRPDLPVCYVQLSAIDRKGWAAFRDSQRRMASEIPGVYMAVSSDCGDSLDVHPRNKRPIARRLARQALHNVYGHTSIAAASPAPIDAQTGRDGTVVVTFESASPLATADGREPRTFEIAAEDGAFIPTRAVIITPYQVMLYPIKEVMRPKYVRYAWQPFTRANLSCADSLPVSTFKIPVSNMTTLYELEPGYDRGISAAYAGRMPSGRIIVAGGCNFPCEEPLAPSAQKKFYSGIYEIDPASLQPSRIGSLPEPIAYGATVPVSDGLILIGGTTAEGATNKVWHLAADLTATPLPPLPATIDNMAAAAIGRTIYVGGGNIDGTPSRRLYALDLDNLRKGWKRLADMPGNPRVQPVMAAAAGKLYVWGGFAGRHAGHEPTLELAGLIFDPATGKWSAVSSPATANGTPVALGGGTAATLASGHIAVAGGVNKDVFLAALIDQAPDYLNHPIAWYSFNPTIYYFDPATAQWAIGPSSPLYARAGAASVAAGDDLILIGGELKPRIRTNQTVIVKK